MARRYGRGVWIKLGFPERTLYRHRQAILKRLEVLSCGTQASALAQATMQSTAQARTDLQRFSSLSFTHGKGVKTKT